jgi:hypothetical protein
VSATTSGAVKAWLEAQGLGVAVYRDAAPNDRPAPLPYITVSEAVALTPDADGDSGDQTTRHTVTEIAQVDVWQTWRTSQGSVAEDYTLPPSVLRALDGASLPNAPGRVYGCRVTSMVRLLEPDTNVVHHAVTVTVNREA